MPIQSNAEAESFNQRSVLFLLPQHYENGATQRNGFTKQTDYSHTNGENGAINSSENGKNNLRNRQTAVK